MAEHLLLDRNLFLTRFGSSDPNNRVLRRLHALVTANPQWLADNAVEWLEDLVHWLFDSGKAPGRPVWQLQGGEARDVPVPRALHSSPTSPCCSLR